MSLLCRTFLNHPAAFWSDAKDSPPFCPNAPDLTRLKNESSLVSGYGKNATRCDDGHLCESQCVNRRSASKSIKAGTALSVLIIVASYVVAGVSQTGATAKAAAAPDPSIFTRIVPSDCRAPSESEIAELKSAVTSFHSRGDRRDEVRALTLLGELYEQLGEFRTALPFLQNALRLSTKDSEDEVRILTLTADAIAALGAPDTAERDATDALTISTKLGNPSLRASALRSRGEAISSVDPKKAIPDIENALRLSEQAGDLRFEAALLNDEGAAIKDSSDPFDLYNRALSIEEQVNDCRDKMATQSNMAELEQDRGQIRTALGQYEDALKLAQQVGDRTSEAMVLHQLGSFHWELGDLVEALSYFNRALDEKRRLGDVTSEADTLGALAGVYRDAKLPTVALRSYREVLPLFEQTKNLQWQVWVLNNLGAVEADLHDPAEARIDYNKSIHLAPSAGDRVTPAFSAWGIGELEQTDALPSYFQSIRMAREYEQPDLEGEVDSSLMDHFRGHHQPNTAIFFGKMAVDQFQSLRRNMEGMSNELTSSFLEIKSATYRTLAEILIEQGRLIEAQQVLDLLKVQQYSDYVGGQASELGEQLARSPREMPLEKGFEDRIKNLVELDKALQTALDAKPRRMRVILEARAALHAAETKFNAFLPDLYRQLESREGPPGSLTAVTGAQLPLERLVKADPRVAALYTLEGKDRYLVMAITHAGRIWRSYAISRPELDAKCQQFLSLLKDPESDVVPSAEEMFAILFGPVQKDLQAAGARTLIWSLDGSLRFIPVAALRDKKTHRYVVEDYAIANFTPLSRSLEDRPKFDHAKAIAMGISSISLDGLPLLTNVPAELDSVAADPDVPDSESHGVMHGKILLDGQFTEKAMERQLQSQAIIHIASHFSLYPGNDDLSYLLLGGKDQDKSGYRYSMAEFERSRDLHIEGTELFTLSACETGAANERNLCAEAKKSQVISAACEAGKINQREEGVVMESMSELVMQKGAEAVLSTLWEVNDISTKLIMDDFYHRWVPPGDRSSKSEALRQAELDLLYDKKMAPPNQDGTTGPSILAHPYYWAPFVVTGNWQ